MAHLEEFKKYKEKLMQTICTSEDIVKYLCLPNEVLSGRDLRYVRIFPYAYVPDVTQDAQAFVCFDADVPSTISGVLKNIQVFVYIFAHQSLMRTQEGVLVDVLSSKVDLLLNGNTGYGLGKMELMSNKRFSPAQNYHGRVSIYSVQDFNRICDKL